MKNIIEQFHLETIAEEKVAKPSHRIESEFHPESSNRLSPIQTFKRTSTLIDRTCSLPSRWTHPRKPIICKTTDRVFSSVCGWLDSALETSGGGCVDFWFLNRNLSIPLTMKWPEPGQGARRSADCRVRCSYRRCAFQNRPQTSESCRQRLRDWVSYEPWLRELWTERREPWAAVKRRRRRLREL